ncbi:MAG TPA: hypothetical protein VF598_13690 [Hymenobacter sp.]
MPYAQGQGQTCDGGLAAGGIGTRHGAFSSAPRQQDCCWLFQPRLFHDERAVARSYTTSS